MKKVKIAIIIQLILFSLGCTSFSQAPAVTKSDKDGYFYTIINKQTYFFYSKISSRNVVVKCQKKTETCETLNFWDEKGYRIW